MKKFIKQTEDFVCENCGVNVEGDGFTNHCPKCLWSKHVDLNPGDRAATCGGLMKPTAAEIGKRGAYSIIHECVICGLRKKNKVSDKDDFNEVIKLSGEPVQ